MATKLVIVESPAKAKTIAKFLGRGYKVEASQGHVRDLPKSQIGVSPENDFEPKYITIRGRGDILNRIRKEARAARIAVGTILQYLAAHSGIECVTMVCFDAVTLAAYQQALTETETANG